MSDNNKKSYIVVTVGEPAGIGPEIIIKLAQQRLLDDVLVIADATLLQKTANELHYRLYIETNNFKNTHKNRLPSLNVYHVPLNHPISPGKPDSANAAYVLNCLNVAIQGCLNGTFSAMVTGPVDKSIIAAAGYPFTGHTEYLAQHSKINKVVMMLTCPEFRVALLTTHIPLREVASHVTDDNLTQTIMIIEKFLRMDFAIRSPRILVCGLNPHAGEKGHLGFEEQQIMIPCLSRLRSQGYDIIGPVPADTAFTKKLLAQTDVVLALYHDQGLPVLKYQGMGEAVNVTLGLPFIRTSVDHGTAYDIAGTGTAQEGSLRAALDLAKFICMDRNKNDL